MTAHDGQTAIHRPASWRDGIRDITQMIVAPQGFTLSIAGVFVVLVGQKGYPGALGVWLFVLGAGLAFSMLVVVSAAHRDHCPPPMRIVGLALLNLVPTVVVPAAGTLSACIPYRHLAFLTAGFTAVTLYTLLLSAYITVVRRRQRAAHRGQAAGGR